MKECKTFSLRKSKQVRSTEKLKTKNKENGKLKWISNKLSLIMLSCQERVPIQPTQEKKGQNTC